MASAKELIKTFLDSGNYITINKKLIHILGLLPAVLLQDLINKHNYFENRKELTEEESFYNTIKNIETDTGLNSYYITFAVKFLCDFDLLIVNKKGMPARNYYKLNFDKIEELFHREIKPSDKAVRSLVTKRSRYKSPNKADIITNNIKDNNIKLTNTVSDETVRGAESSKADSSSSKNNSSKLRSRTELNKSSYKKKESSINEYFPIEEETNQLKIDYKNLIVWINTLEFIQKCKMEIYTKKLHQAFLYYSAMRQGKFSEYATMIKDWDFPLPTECLNGRIYSDEEIRKLIKLYLLQFQVGYWPFTDEEKKKLPRSINTIFYNPYNSKCPSPILKVLVQPPQKVKDKIAPTIPIDQDCVNIMKCGFEEIYGSSLSESNIDRLTQIVNMLCAEISKQYPLFIKTVSEERRKDIVFAIGGQERFIKYYMEWIIERSTHFVRNDKDPVDIEMIKPLERIETWKSFLKHLNKTLGVNFYPTDSEIEYAEKENKRRSTPIPMATTPIMPWEEGSEWSVDFDGLDQTKRIECRKMCKGLKGTIEEQTEKINEFFGIKIIDNAYNIY
ncbi:MAG: hypothetical protein WC549_09450 [Actinomycetota bacterium]